MANNNQFLITDGYQPPAGNNSFTTNWIDKRSGKSVGLSLVFRGSSSPTGTAVVQTSNVPSALGTNYGQPGNTDDAQTYPNSSVAITTTGTTQWEIVCSARWVRIVYTASSSVSGLNVSAYANVPYLSD